MISFATDGHLALNRAERSQPYRLFLNKLLHRAIHGIGHIDLALGTHGDEVGFSELAPSARCSRFADRREDFAVQVEAEHLAGESIDHDDFLLADLQRARQPRVLEFLDEFPILIEDLDALVFAIGDPELALRVEGEAVGNVELAGLGAFAAPEFDEVAVLIELEDTGILALQTAAASGSGRVALRDEEVSVGGDGDIIGFVEKLRGLVPVAKFALGAESHQDLALRVELHDCVRADVGGPDIAVLIDAQTVAAGEEAVAEGADELAVLVELGKRLRSAAQDIQMALGIERDAGGWSHRGGVGNRERVGHRYVVQQRSFLRDQQGWIRGPLRHDAA